MGRAGQTKKELEYFKEKGVRIIFLDIPTTKIDISSFNDAMAQMILAFINDMLISFYDLIARTELERKQKRQREGIEAMKAKGEWSRYGRPRCMSKEEFSKQYEQVLIGVIGTLELQRKLGLNKDTFFRYVREYKKERAL